MKAAAMAEIEAEQAKAERYAEGYYEGFSDGYDRALKDIQKLRGVAVEEMVRGDFSVLSAENKQGYITIPLRS
jgi:flagellar biosynthesis/type III secretory pathway protein FliH